MKSRLDIDFTDERFLMFVIDDMANHMEYDEGKEVIRLTLGKSELPLHDDIIKVMQNALGDFKKSALVYPGGLPVLKEELSKYYKEEFQVDIPAKNFIIGPGTSTLFRNLFAILSDKRDDVLLPHPYYSLYRFSAMLAGANVNYYKIDPKTKRLDLDSFKANFTDKTKIVVINTPGNPLGNVLTDEELYAIDEIVNGQAVIINDEIYANVYFDQKNKSVMNLKNTKSTFITTNAFSKAYRMYSRRVGYCIVPDDFIEPMTVMLHHTQLTVDPVVQFGAIEALHKPEEVKTLVKGYKERRDYTTEKLRNIEGIKPIHSEGGFYYVVDCEEYMKKHNYPTSLRLAEDLIMQKQVATVPGSDFGLPYTIRLSFSAKKYKEGIDRLVDFFREGRMNDAD
ncbi:pyridoxal phosphate-dependent aminotransferase [[Clostridium] polysaccharolyticum]|uniref:Aspartate aminotransferase n=1 Tax=[Clostridium] polysaccharolyticum TaxID=29364 RepID=A0A1I0C5Q7_9FIRM|nr:aminotransferase class I/II-fold pyridoxal phosphate-dependent enzyme [[Clostridium] polysaccharolyticum]SET14240.1 aspartate aminotransferase [[Clostridium] polysaccharolyticum]